MKASAKCPKCKCKRKEEVAAGAGAGAAAAAAWSVLCGTLGGAVAVADTFVSAKEEDVCCSRLAEMVIAPQEGRHVNEAKHGVMPGV